jgi:hypothetical protein
LGSTGQRFGTRFVVVVNVQVGVVVVSELIRRSPRPDTDLLIHPTRPIDIPAIADAVGRVMCRVIEIRPVSVHELEDPVTRSMRFMASRSDLACVIDAYVARRASVVAGRSLRAQRRGAALLMTRRASDFTRTGTARCQSVRHDT